MQNGKIYIFLLLLFSFLLVVLGYWYLLGYFNSVFQNREEAGVLLAEKLKKYKKSSEAIILAIPRGGVVIGRQIADSLHLPLSILVVKKLGAPGNPELAIGAVAPNGVKFVDPDLALRLGVDQEYLEEEIEKKGKEIAEREKIFRSFMRSNLRGGSTSLEKKKIIILTDDGVATGATILAAIKYIKQQLTINNKQLTIILAVPVIARDTYDQLKSEVDKLIALEIPEFFGAVGQFYREFGQVTDEEVIEILASRK